MGRKNRIILNTNEFEILIPDKIDDDVLSTNVENDSRPKKMLRSRKRSSSTPVSSIKHVCTYCSLTFDSPLAIERHLRDVHSVVVPSTVHNVENISIADAPRPKRTRIQHKCALCLKTFGSRSSIQRHLKEIHNGGVSSIPNINLLQLASGCTIQPLPVQVADKSPIKLNPTNFFKILKLNSNLSQSTSDCTVQPLPVQVVDKSAQKLNTPRKRNRFKILNPNSNLSQASGSAVQLPSAQVKDESAPKLKRSQKSGPQRRVQVKYTCAFCSKKFPSKLRIEMHLKEAHNGLVASNSDEPGDECVHCGKKFVDKVKLKNHLKKHSRQDGESLECDICHKKFCDRYVLKRHKKNYHSNPLDDDDEFWGVPAATPTPAEDEITKKLAVMVDDKKYYQCDQCPYRCGARPRMVEHRRIHTGERPFFCEKCGKRFNNKTLLRNHLLAVHEGCKNFACDICGKTFFSKHYVDEHRRIHTGEKPYVCDICGSAYTHLTSLLTHKNRHSVVRKFKCTICPETFTYRSAWNLHIRRHTGDYRYTCDVCGKLFIDRQHLTRHLAVHSDAKPFSCNICGATFKLGKYLGSHKKVHRKKESRAALEGEKWDPLISPPCLPQTSLSTTTAEDRAKLVKSKKLGPLMRNYKGDDVAVLECGQCTAFFIDKNDYEKHLKSHDEPNSNEAACTSIEHVYMSEYSDVDENDATKLEEIAILTKTSKKKDSGETSSKGCRTSSRQKLRIKVGGDVVVKKTAKKLSSRSLSSADGSNIPASSSQRRRSIKLVSYVEPDDIDIKGAKPCIYDESEIPVTKGVLGKDAKKRRYSEVSEYEVPSSEDDIKLEKSDMHIEVIEETILPDRIITKKISRERKTVSDGETKSKKPRLKRLRRVNEDEDEKCQTIYTCGHCLRNFRRKSNLKRHMSKLHVGKEKEGGDRSKWFTGYCCDICGEGLQVRSMMMAHRDVIHSECEEIEWCKYQTSLARVKFCNECKKYFRGGKSFDEHDCDKGKSIGNEELARLLKDAEDVNPTFFCYICNLCFKWRWDYRAHRESEHKDAPPIDWTSLKPIKLEFFCDKCSKAYNDGTMLKNHLCSAVTNPANDAVVKPFRCDLCGNDYFWKSDFRRHMRTKHPKENCKPTEHDTIIYSCPYCEEKFSMKKRILHHMRKAHNITSDSPFVCVKCNKVFRRRDNLDRHNESYHPTLNDQEEANKILTAAEIKINGEIAYHCDVCNRNISNPNRFISHYRGHYSENKFTCDLCGKQAKTQHQLNTHIKNIHLNIRNYKCDICSKSFYTKQACEEHRRIHTGERPFSCEICGKTFVAGNALISHKRFHNDFYPHSCHMCPKKFKVRRSLINHIRTHTGERPFKCDLCTKTFNNSSQYSYHKKVTHSEARPFSCSLCGHCFKANKFLTRHMELHTVRSQIQTRKPNNPAHYTTSKIKSSADTSQSVVGTTVTSVSHQQQPQPVHQQHQPIRVNPAEQLVPSTPIMTAQVQPVQHVTPTTVYVKELPSSTSTTFRNDDLVTDALYNLQRGGYEANGNEFVRTAPAPDCDINAMGSVKRNFSLADAYAAAATYAIGSEDYKNTSNTVNRPYNPASQTPSNHSVAAGKHMTWL